TPARRKPTGSREASRLLQSRLSGTFPPPRPAALRRPTVLGSALRLPLGSSSDPPCGFSSVLPSRTRLAVTPRALWRAFSPPNCPPKGPFLIPPSKPVVL